MALNLQHADISDVHTDLICRCLWNVFIFSSYVIFVEFVVRVDRVWGVEPLLNFHPPQSHAFYIFSPLFPGWSIKPSPWFHFLATSSFRQEKCLNMCIFYLKNQKKISLGLWDGGIIHRHLLVASDHSTPCFFSVNLYSAVRTNYKLWKCSKCYASIHYEREMFF